MGAEVHQQSGGSLQSAWFLQTVCSGGEFTFYGPGFFFLLIGAEGLLSAARTNVCVKRLSP